MQLPFHVRCEGTHPLLLELKDGRFQQLQPGALPPLVVGYGFVLANSEVASFLHGLNVDRALVSPAKVWLAWCASELHTHSRVRVGQFFTEDQIRDLNLEGDKLLTLGDQALFVSPTLKQKMEVAFPYLEFSEGLDGFAANAI